MTTALQNPQNYHPHRASRVIDNIDARYDRAGSQFIEAQYPHDPKLRALPHTDEAIAEYVEQNHDKLKPYLQGLGVDPTLIDEIEAFKLAQGLIARHKAEGAIIFDISALNDALLQIEQPQGMIPSLMTAPFPSQYFHLGPTSPLVLTCGDIIEGIYLFTENDKILVLAIPLRDLENHQPGKRPEPNLHNLLTYDAYELPRMADDKELFSRTDSFLKTTGIIDMTELELGQFFHLLSAAIAYIHGDPADVIEDWPDHAPKDLVLRANRTNPGERTKWTSKLQALDFHKVHIVGRNHKARTTATIDEAQRQGISTHWRRGHWRRVVTGKGRTGREWRLFPPVLVLGHGDAPDSTIYIPPTLH
jgi:hypothetical protein